MNEILVEVFSLLVVAIVVGVFIWVFRSQKGPDDDK